MMITCDVSSLTFLLLSSLQGSQCRTFFYEQFESASHHFPSADSDGKSDKRSEEKLLLLPLCVEVVCPGF